MRSIIPLGLAALALSLAQSIRLARIRKLLGWWSWITIQETPKIVGHQRRPANVFEWPRHVGRLAFVRKPPTHSPPTQGVCGWDSLPELMSKITTWDMTEVTRSYARVASPLARSRAYRDYSVLKNPAGVY